MSTDLKDDATHEEIEAFAEQAAKEVEEARQGEKGDAQRIAEEGDKPVTERTPGETDSASDTAQKGEEPGPESQAQEWLDDNLKAETAAYGISEEELADFQSREEVDRALRLFDRSALDAGRKALAEGEEGKQGRDEAGRFLKKEPEDEKPETKPTEGQYEIGLDKDLYPDESAELTRLRDHYEGRLSAYDARLSALEDQLEEANARVEEQVFDGLVDSLGHADLFGKTGKETAKELERRKDLIIAVKAHQIGSEMLGRQVDLNQSLVARVARMVFADELAKKDLKARTRKVSKQSDGRMGGGGTKSPGPEESPEEWAKRRYKELEEAGG